MKNLKRILCLVLVCVLMGSLLPMTAAAEDIKITSMEFSVENLKVGEKGTALKAHVAGDQPITLNNLATLRYDDAGEPGLLVKSDLLQEGTVYWLCINPVVKSGYSLTPYVMLQKESWTINGLPYGMAIDKVVQSGSQVRFRLTPLLKEVDTLSITGVPAPKYGQKVKEYYSVWTDVFDKGTGKVNGVAYAGNWLFEGIFLAEGAILNEGKKEINPETQISADTYYMWYRFECVPGRVFTEDIQVSVEGAISAEAEFYGDALLVYAKYEVPEPVFTEQPVGGDVAPGETKTVKWATNFTPVKNVLFKVKTHPVDGMKVTSENLGTATTAEVGAGYEYFIIRSYYSDSGYVNSNEFYVNELETCTVTYDYESKEDVVKQFDKGISIYDAAVAFAPPADTKAGYVFDEWVLSEDTPTDSLEDPENPSSTKIIGDVRFVPRWLKCYDEIHFEFSGYELGANISDGVLTDDIDGYAPQKMPDLLGGNNYVIVADKGGKPDMTDPNTMFKIVTGKFEANTDYWLMVMIGGEGRDITGHIKLDVAGIDDCFLDSPECTDKWWFAAGEGEFAFFKLKPLAPTTYTITFDSDGGSAVAAQSVKEGETAKMPTDPTKEGLDFFGWYTKDGELYEFETPVTGNIELYAKFGYTVLFWLDSSDEYAIAWRNVEPGQKAEEQAEPGREGATFLGWFTADGKKFDFNTPINSNLDLYAKFEDLPPAHTHTYTDGLDGTCNGCGAHREEVETRVVVHMFRMYNPNTGEHFYTGSTEERDNLIGHGWQYEGIGFTFPANTGLPVHRLFQPSTGEHLYTMSEAEKDKLMAEGWNYEGIAFNSAYDTEAVQHRLHNPNATVGAYHFTFSQEEMNNLIAAGWEYQGIGWYSCWK